MCHRSPGPEHWPGLATSANWKEPKWTSSAHIGWPTTLQMQCSTAAGCEPEETTWEQLTGIFSVAPTLICGAWLGDRCHQYPTNHHVACWWPIQRPLSARWTIQLGALSQLKPRIPKNVTGINCHFRKDESGWWGDNSTMRSWRRVPEVPRLDPRHKYFYKKTTNPI